MTGPRKKAEPVKLDVLKFDKVIFTKRTNGTLAVGVSIAEGADQRWFHGDIDPKELDKLREFLNANH